MNPIDTRSKFVAVSQRVVEVEAREEARDCLDQQWTVWLRSIGLTCVPIPNHLHSVGEFLEKLKPRGIVLTGGNNLSLPVYDGLLSGATITDAYECRDLTEKQLIEYALSERLPVLGCCRGMQYLHAYFGGRLELLSETPVCHVNREHPIVLVDDKFCSLSTFSTLSVNSFHNYGFKHSDLPSPFLPFALSPEDDVVEGFFHPNLPLLGIMWHPERSNAAYAFDRALASWLFYPIGSRF